MKTTLLDDGAIESKEPSYVTVCTTRILMVSLADRDAARRLIVFV